MEVLSQRALFTVRSRHRRLLADTLTPGGVCMRLRDRFPNQVLFEIKATHGDGAAYSYLCFEPVARFESDGILVKTSYPDGSFRQNKVSRKSPLLDQLDRFRTCFEAPATRFPFQTNGLFGQPSYNAVQQFEAISLEAAPSQTNVPDMVYQVFRYVLVFHHPKNELHLFEHSYSENLYTEPTDSLDTFEYLLKTRSTPTYPFQTNADEVSTVTDEEFRQTLERGKPHCLRGDVLLTMLSRPFLFPSGVLPSVLLSTFGR